MRANFVLDAIAHFTRTKAWIIFAVSLPNTVIFGAIGEFSPAGKWAGRSLIGPDLSLGLSFDRTAGSLHGCMMAVAGLHHRAGKMGHEAGKCHVSHGVGFSHSPLSQLNFAPSNRPKITR